MNPYLLQRGDMPVVTSAGAGAPFNVHPLLRRTARARRAPLTQCPNAATAVLTSSTELEGKPLVPMELPRASNNSFGMQAGVAAPTQAQTPVTELPWDPSLPYDLSQAAQHEWPGLRTWRAKGRDLRLQWCSLGSPTSSSGPVLVRPHEAPSLDSPALLHLLSPSSPGQHAAPPASRPPSPLSQAPTTPAPDPGYAARSQATARIPTPARGEDHPGSPGGAPAAAAAAGPAVPHLDAPPQGTPRPQTAVTSLVSAGLRVLHTPCPRAKAALTHAAWGAYLEGRLALRDQHPPLASSTSVGVATAGGGKECLEVDAGRSGLLATGGVGAEEATGGGDGGRRQQQQQLGGWTQAHVTAGEQQQGQMQGERPSQTSSAVGDSSSSSSSGNSSGSPRQAVGALLPEHPARPERPRLVRPKEIPGHESSPLGLNGYMLHNLAHIELNAIDLAWDTVVRFSHLDLPNQFYEDFARVADDESRHLGWCLQRLRELGHSYGDMDAHDLLWQGCAASAGDLGARLAVVPMSQEARGLDAGGRLVQRLVGAGDVRSAALVGLIAEEERAHVAVGVTWFTRVCGALGLTAGELYRRWLLHLNPDLLKGPFNHSERALVGLPRDWYDPTAWRDASETPDKGREQEQEGGGKGGAASPPNPAPAPRQQGRPLQQHSGVTRSLPRPVRGSRCPRLAGPQPVLSEGQLAALAEWLAGFLGVESAAASGGGCS